MRLKTQGVLSEDEATTLHLLAGYRNRLVYFYHEVSALRSCIRSVPNN